MAKFWRVRGKQYSITLQLYHNEPPGMYGGENWQHLPTSENDVVRNIRVRQVWDSFETEELIGAAMKPFSNRQIANGMKRAYESALDLNWYERPVEDNIDISVFHLSGSKEDFVKYTQAWADALVNEAPQVGGDDSYFDYFPDEVGGLLQLCKAIKAEELYRQAYAKILAAYTAHDCYEDGLISAWTDLKA